MTKGRCTRCAGPRDHHRYNTCAACREQSRARQARFAEQDRPTATLRAAEIERQIAAHLAASRGRFRLTDEDIWGQRPGAPRLSDHGAEL